MRDVPTQPATGILYCIQLHIYTYIYIYSIPVGSDSGFHERRNLLQTTYMTCSDCYYNLIDNNS